MSRLEISFRNLFQSAVALDLTIQEGFLPLQRKFKGTLSNQSRQTYAAAYGDLTEAARGAPGGNAVSCIFPPATMLLSSRESRPQLT